MLNKKNKTILISLIAIICILLLVVILLPDNRTHMQYKDFKSKALSGDVLTASVNSKEILFTLTNKSR